MSTSDRDDMTTVVMACEEFMASTGIAPERLRQVVPCVGDPSDPAAARPQQTERPDLTDTGIAGASETAVPGKSGTPAAADPSEASASEAL